MKSLSPRLASAYLRRRVKRGLETATSLREARRVFDLQLPHAEPPGGFRAERIGGVAGEWAGEGGATLLYLHGGAFFAGSPRHYRPISCAFASLGFSVFTPAYRLAPRHPFPAALDDARAVYAALAGRGGGMVIAGDSAGGGLALSLMISRRDAGLPLPAAAALFSPWTDLAVTGASARDNEGRDPLFSRRMLKNAARAYLVEENSRNPLASPLYGDLRGLPPLLLHASTSELLRDDSERLAARAVEAGVAARVALWPGAPHCWQLAAALMPQALQSIEQAAAFLRERMGEGLWPHESA
jgi:epsilon-lactone hydrolase